MSVYRVIDVKCPICFAKVGQMCTNKPAFRGSGVHTVPAHTERRDEFNRRKAEQDGQERLEISPLGLLKLTEATSIDVASSEATSADIASGGTE